MVQPTETGTAPRARQHTDGRHHPMPPIVSPGGTIDEPVLVGFLRANNMRFPPILQEQMQDNTAALHPRSAIRPRRLFRPHSEECPRTSQHVAVVETATQDEIQRGLASFSFGRVGPGGDNTKRPDR